MSFQAEPDFMRLAIADAEKHLADEGGGPFGACIVRGEQVLAVAHNTVLESRDPSCHAEVNAIRQACQKVQHYDLSGCTIYSTTEPCPMCFSTIHWAKIDRIVFGTRIEDVQALGFNELEISNSTMISQGKSPVLLVEDFLRDECLQLLSSWRKNTQSITY